MGSASGVRFPQRQPPSLLRDLIDDATRLPPPPARLLPRETPEGSAIVHGEDIPGRNIDPCRAEAGLRSAEDHRSRNIDTSEIWMIIELVFLF